MGIPKSPHLANTCYYLSFCYCYEHSSGCEVTSHCHLNLHFSDGALHIFIYMYKGVLKSLHQELVNGKLAIMLKSSYFVTTEEKGKFGRRMVGKL